MWHACCTGLHTHPRVLQVRPFRKQMIQCSHQLHNQAYSIAARLHCGYVLWMEARGVWGGRERERGSDRNKKSESGWTQNLTGGNENTQHRQHTGGCPQTVCARWMEPDAASRSHAASPVSNPGPGSPVCGCAWRLLADTASVVTPDLTSGSTSVLTQSFLVPAHNLWGYICEPCAD